MGVIERELRDPWEGLFVAPSGADAGVVVLGGSGGRVERERARLLAAHGVAALAIRWFGGPGQSPGICEIPLETFTAAISGGPGGGPQWTPGVTGAHTSTRDGAGKGLSDRIRASSQVEALS